MDIKGKVAVVTGGASGIGKALCERFHADGAAAIAVMDLNADGARAVASSVGGLGFGVDVTDEGQLSTAIADIERACGGIDLMCSNAGVAFGDGPDFTAASCPNELWELSWGVNVMAHVYAVRAALPKMLERGGGYFLHTVSAAGLLSQIGSAPYSTTKHAAIGFAESVAIAHGHQNIKVSVLCPQAVATPMLGDDPDGNAASVDGVIMPEAVADCVVQGLANEKFLILPHPDVRAYMERKTSDYDRWLGGMRRLRERLFSQ